MSGTALAGFDCGAAEFNGTSRRNDRRPRAADLHLGHDRSAEGGQHQSPPHPELGRLVCRTDDASPEDRLFNCLPLFHSVGGVVAPCSMLAAGASVVLSEKFSAGTFWRDVVRWDCTLFQYIGELCRYLLKAQRSEFEKQHRLTACLRQRLARRCLGGISGAIFDPAGPGVLRGDRRQFLALQCRRKTRRDRPDPAAAGASLSRRDRSHRS